MDYLVASLVTFCSDSPAAMHLFLVSKVELLYDTQRVLEH